MKNNIAVLAKGKGKLPEKCEGYTNRWRTGDWKCAEGKINHLIGNVISCHDKQNGESFHQGIIVGFMREDDNRYTIIYDYMSTPIKGKDLEWGARQSVCYF